MIPDNYEYLLEYQGYRYHVLEEIGFSNKVWADNNLLYQDFHDGLPSGFKDIYTNNLYNDYTISQICITLEGEPIGICMGIYDPIQVKDTLYGFTTTIAGKIELYVKDNHRQKGLAAHAVPLLESMLEKQSHYPNAIIMEQAAFPLGKYLKTGMPLSRSLKQGNTMGNRHKLVDYYSQILNTPQMLEKYSSKFSGFKEEYEAKDLARSLKKRSL